MTTAWAILTTAAFVVVMAGEWRVRGRWYDSLVLLACMERAMAAAGIPL